MTHALNHTVGQRHSRVQLDSPIADGLAEASAMFMPNENDNHHSTDLDALRQRIDEIDRRLIQTLSDRARVVVDIGKLKQTSNSPTYAPHREKQVIEKALALNEGPLPARTIEAIYRELMSGSFSLERHPPANR